MLSLVSTYLAMKRQISTDLYLDDFFSAMTSQTSKYGEKIFNGAIRCEPACGGEKPCFKSCGTKGHEGWNRDGTFVHVDTATTFSDVIGLNINSRNIEYDRSEAPLHCDIEVLVKASLY